jgi:hypothetical protein
MWTIETDRLPKFMMTTPIDPPLWFVRDLFVTMLLSKPLYHLLKKRLSCVIFLGVLLLWWFSGCYQYLLPGISVPCILFFSIGATIGIHKIDIMNLINGKRNEILLMFLLFLIFMVKCNYYVNGTDKPELEYSLPINNLYTLISIPAYLLIASYLTKHRKTDAQSLAPTSFVVFASHWMTLTIMKRIMGKLLSGNYDQTVIFLFQMVLYIVPVVVGVIIYLVIKRHEKIKMLLSGGR